MELCRRLSAGVSLHRAPNRPTIRTNRMSFSKTHCWIGVVGRGDRSDNRPRELMPSPGTHNAGIALPVTCSQISACLLSALITASITALINFSSAWGSMVSDCIDQTGFLVLTS